MKWLGSARDKLNVNPMHGLKLQYIAGRRERSGTEKGELNGKVCLFGRGKASRLRLSGCTMEYLEQAVICGDWAIYGRSIPILVLYIVNHVTST